MVISTGTMTCNSYIFMFQHYEVSENRIQFCPNFCENVTVIHDFCQAADRERDCLPLIKMDR